MPILHSRAVPLKFAGFRDDGEADDRFNCGRRACSNHQPYFWLWRTPLGHAYHTGYGLAARLRGQLHKIQAEVWNAVVEVLWEHTRGRSRTKRGPGSRDSQILLLLHSCLGDVPSDNPGAMAAGLLSLGGSLCVVRPCRCQRVHSSPGLLPARLAALGSVDFETDRKGWTKFALYWKQMRKKIKRMCFVK